MGNYWNVVHVNPDIALDRRLVAAINDAITDYLQENIFPEDQELTSYGWHIVVEY
tara:strand:+ start:1270 stop:1434 length:165 start_codon:yes stop_codon:yes gene_type:complete